MSHQILEEDHVSYQIREVEKEVSVIIKNTALLFQILDEYERLVELSQSEK